MTTMSITKTAGLVPMRPPSPVIITKSAPRYVAAEFSQYGTHGYDEDYWRTGLTEEQVQKIALRMDWIYSALDLLAREAASVDMFVRGPHSRADREHPVLDLMRSPNEFMTQSFLLRFVIYWLFLSRKGAFLYLAPDPQTGEITEIWPIKSSQIEVVKAPRAFVSYFRYQPVNDIENRRVYRLRPEHVVWFRYPDPFDYWASLSPLRSLLDVMQIASGIDDSQKKFYGQSRGIPMSIVSVDPDMTDADYARVREDIRTDWANKGTTIAITRGGSVDIKSLGFTQKELEVLGSQALTRDRIDSVIFGVPFRADSVMASGDGMEAADAFMKSKAIRPLHRILAEQLSLSLRKHFSPKLILDFDDVRAQDRSLSIQEAQVQARWSTMNDMRVTDNREPLNIPGLDGLGDLPVMLATNPTFVLKWAGLDNNAATDEAAAPEVGNLDDAQDPEQLTNQLAEMKAWRKVSRRLFREGEHPHEYGFESNILDTTSIRSRMPAPFQSVDEIDGFFEDEIQLLA